MLALLSDLHANLPALEACLAHARAQGARRFAFLGDLVGYNADAREVVTRVADLAAAGAIVIKGNHDEAVEATAGYLNDSARAAVDWARASLSTEQRAFLAALPLIHREDDLCLAHATVDAPENWDYLDSPGAAQKSMAAADRTYTFVGHVHDQRLYSLVRDKAQPFRPVAGVAIPVPPHRRWLALVGSVGQPRDRNPAAAYCLFDRAAGRLTFCRVPYDVAAAAASIRKAGLPEGLAYRLERGA